MFRLDQGNLPQIRHGTVMNIVESALTFTCDGESLVGVVSEPEDRALQGVLIVVGGPQYRAGSHRQFTLLARHLAHSGIPTMRFDYRGMGDSDGEARSFEQITPDIRSAIDAFIAWAPYLEEIVLWGLCDAASAIMFYAHTDARVRGITLVNPWVRTAEGLAKARIRHYYTARFINPSFWRKLVMGDFRFSDSLKDLLTALQHSLSPRLLKSRRIPITEEDPTPPIAPLPDRMQAGLARFKGDVLLILSGRDLVAGEFEDTIRTSPKWRTLLGRKGIEIHRLPMADHTFSRAQWSDHVAEVTTRWVQSGSERSRRSKNDGTPSD